MRKKLIELFGGGLKTSPTITKVDPFVPTTKAEKTARDLRRAKQKTKASKAKLDNTIFRINQQKKRLEEQRNKNKKMGGGFMGKRMGYKKGTPKPDFLDFDKDGNTSESMKKALKDKKND